MPELNPIKAIANFKRRQAQNDQWRQLDPENPTPRKEHGKIYNFFNRYLRLDETIGGVKIPTITSRSTQLSPTSKKTHEDKAAEKEERQGLLAQESDEQRPPRGSYTHGPSQASTSKQPTQGRD